MTLRLAADWHSSSGHLAVLFLAPLVLLTGAVVTAYTGLRLRLMRNRPGSA